MVIITPNIKIAFRIFPIPKYFKNRKKIKDEDSIIPLLVFARIVAKVKSKEKNKIIKKTIIIPKVSGSIK